MCVLCVVLLSAERSTPLCKFLLTFLASSFFVCDTIICELPSASGDMVPLFSPTAQFGARSLSLSTPALLTHAEVLSRNNRQSPGLLLQPPSGIHHPSLSFKGSLWPLGFHFCCSSPLFVIASSSYPLEDVSKGFAFAPLFSFLLSSVLSSPVYTSASETFQLVLLRDIR